MSGWVCSYRTIWNHPFFKGHGMRVAVWHWLLHHAAWKDTEHTISSVKVAIKRGEVCFSQQQIQDETGATRKQVRDVLEWLLKNEKAAKIGANERANGGAKVRANAKTILRIEKYEEYQSKKDEGANEKANSRAVSGPTKEQDKQINNTPVGEAEASKPVSVSVVTTALWNAGKQYLSANGVKSPGGLIGRWLKDHNALSILNAIEAAQQAGTQDPVPYITEVLKGEINGPRVIKRGEPSNGHQNRPDPALEQIARLTGIGGASGHGRC